MLGNVAPGTDGKGENAATSENYSAAVAWVVAKVGAVTPPVDRCTDTATVIAPAFANVNVSGIVIAGYRVVLRPSSWIWGAVAAVPMLVVSPLASGIVNAGVALAALVGAALADEL